MRDGAVTYDVAVRRKWLFRLQGMSRKGMITLILRHPSGFYDNQPASSGHPRVFT